MFVQINGSAPQPAVVNGKTPLPPERPVNVALVSMPLMSPFRPSIQLGLLKAIAAEHGFSASTFHYYVNFAHRIGWRVNSVLSERRGHWGDWIFSLAAFGDEAPDPNHEMLDALSSDVDLLQEELRSVEGDRPAGDMREILRKIRTVDAPFFISELLHAVPWHEFQVVGFTSTFQQNVASFALAGAIKNRYPHIVTVFGGANFEGEMGLELAGKVPAIDWAFIGEADESFPEFLRAMSAGRDPSSIPGLVRRNGASVTPLLERQPFDALDSLPVPDYKEYFDQVKRFGLSVPNPTPGTPIPFESARGCWWGAKHHCTFCGLNAATMSFRSKTPDRVIAELSELARRHQSFNFDAVDNILDLKYLNGIFKNLQDNAYDFSFFYEVKSNLTREQIRAMRMGGVCHIQPGIESLSTHVLQLMEKGVTAIQNVNLLRWCFYYNIAVGWNLIWGFPGETADDYQGQLDLLRKLVHLEPPNVGGRISMVRFSPVFFDRERFPAQSVKPEAGYRYIYPHSIDLYKVAYFFDYQLEHTLPADFYRPTREHVAEWRELWTGSKRPSLTFWKAPQFLVIDDRCDPQHATTHHFLSPAAELYENCSDKPQSARALSAQLNTVSETEATETLDGFCDQGLMMRDGRLYLSLALPKLSGR